MASSPRTPRSQWSPRGDGADGFLGSNKCQESMDTHSPEVITGSQDPMALQVPTSTRSPWAPRNVLQQLTDSQELTHGFLGSNRHWKSVGTHKSTSAQELMDTRELMDTQQLMEEVGDLNTPFHAPARTSPAPPAWIHVLEASEVQPPASTQLCPTGSQCLVLRGSPHPAASGTAGIWGRGGTTELARNAHSPRHITVEARGDSFPALSLSQQHPGVGRGWNRGGSASTDLRQVGTIEGRAPSPLTEALSHLHPISPGFWATQKHQKDQTRSPTASDGVSAEGSG